MPCPGRPVRARTARDGDLVGDPPWAQGTFLEHTRLFRVLFFCMLLDRSPTSPRSWFPPVTAWHRNWCLHIFSLFLSFFPLPQTIQATCLILCFLLVSTLSPTMVMKFLLLIILFVVL